MQPLDPEIRPPGSQCVRAVASESSVRTARWVIESTVRGARGFLPGGEAA